MTTGKTAAEEAAKLIKDTAEATALSLNVQYIQRDIQEIKQDMQKDRAEIKDVIKEISKEHESFSNTFVRKEEFLFWRNLLVSGLLVTITIGLVFNLLQ